MDNINKNQEEKNRENLDAEAAVKKIKELVDIAKTCFLTTEVSSSQSYGTRPMTVQKVDDAGVIWFLVANDSHTYKDIAANPKVKLHFQGSAHSDFLYLEGNAELLADRGKMRELWEPIMKTWFTEGLDDSRIAVLKVSPISGYYWDTKHGNYIAGIKMMIGAVIGKTMDDSIEGKIQA
ncbi:pyridoxamine 5'-phosphate oxidase family protein [Pedobacter immunditicola]|uniref:pyridoxamine 5'-phosphate oxidase family protein n=1 Tax=Pedobacter immunditicola TaxID=3133440 RepID=UPI0030A44774